MAQRNFPIAKGVLVGDLDANQHKIKNLPDPIEGGDAANKDYVDNHGIDPTILDSKRGKFDMRYGHYVWNWESVDEAGQEYADLFNFLGAYPIYATQNLGAWSNTKKLPRNFYQIDDAIGGDDATELRMSFIDENGDEPKAFRLKATRTEEFVLNGWVLHSDGGTDPFFRGLILFNADTGEIEQAVAGQDYLDEVNWDEVKNKPNSFPPDGHAHTSDDVMGLDERLAGIDGEIDKIKATARPNVTIVGEPLFSGGSVSEFSPTDYLVFPSSVSVGDSTVDFDIAIQTGANVTTQENILDSACGIALAIRNGQFVYAVSTNGTNFENEIVCGSVLPHTPYRLRISWWKDALYHCDLKISDGEGEFTTIGEYGSASPTASRPLYFGGANPITSVHHIFSGVINLSGCALTYNGKEVWNGWYTSVPRHTHATDDIANLAAFVDAEIAAKAKGEVKSEAVAPKFDAEKSYKANEHVMYEGLLYAAKVDVAAGAWDATKWQAVGATDAATYLATDDDGHLLIRSVEDNANLYVDAYRLTNAVKDASIANLGTLTDANKTIPLPSAIDGYSRDFVVIFDEGADVVNPVLPIAESSMVFSDAIPTFAANTRYMLCFTEVGNGKWIFKVVSEEIA